MYPKPASGTFFLDLSAHESESFNLKLIDMAGRVVVQQRVSVEAGAKRLTEIRTDQLAKGLYSVVCSTGDDILRQHLVLQ